VKEHHLEVVRTARYWTTGTADGPAEVWFVLHGYRQLARRFLRRFEPIDDGRRLIVAPEALSRFYVSTEQGRHGSASVVGATWMTREDRQHEIDDYVRYLDRLAEDVLGPPGAPRPRIVVLGFSQGVATATRWVVHGAVRPDRLLLWGDFTPPDLDLSRAREALADVEVVTVRGTEDPALSSRLAEEEAVRLAKAGLHVRAVRYDGGHDIDADTLVALARESGNG
jgi:predicted esterase